MSSILISGGKETLQRIPLVTASNREEPSLKIGRLSPALNPAVPPLGNVVFGRIRLSRDVELRPSPS